MAHLYEIFIYGVSAIDLWSSMVLAAIRHEYSEAAAGLIALAIFSHFLWFYWS